MSGSAFAVTHYAFSSGAGRTSDGNGSHASTLKSPSYTKSVSWQHYHEIETYMDGVHLICTTARVDRSFGDIPLVHGMPFVSGVGIEALQNKILTILQG